MTVRDENTGTHWEACWTAFGFDDTQTPEAVDACLEQMLDASECILRPHEDEPHATLSALLGLSGDNLFVLTGEVPAFDVAMVRSVALQSALAACLRTAESALQGQSGHGFLHALAVCGCLQFDALGDVQASQQAFSVQEWGRKNAQSLLEGFIAAHRAGTASALAFIRSVLREQGKSWASVIAPLSVLQTVESIQPPQVQDEHVFDDVLSVCSFVEALTDIVATGPFFAAVNPSESEKNRVGYGEQIVAAIAGVGAQPGAGIASGFSHRYGQYLSIWGKGTVSALHTLCNAPMPPHAAEQVWRKLTCIPTLQVVGTFLAVPGYVFGRVGPTETVDEQVSPLLRQLMQAPEKELEIQDRLLAASGLVTVLAHLADIGVLTGKLPSGEKTRSYFVQHCQRAEDTVRCNGQQVFFDRRTRLGRILGAVADAATVLAYRAPENTQSSAAAISPLGWISMPLHDDPRFDLAASVVLSVYPLLDALTCVSLSELVRCVRVPEVQQSATQLGILLQKDSMPLRPQSKSVERLLSRYWDMTAGLSKHIPEQVNALGQVIGHPLGGAKILSDCWLGDDGYDGNEAVLLSQMGVSVNLPPRTIAGHTMTDMAYWKLAQLRGKALRNHVGDILGKKSDLSLIFQPDSDADLAQLLLTYLALRADEQARYDAIRLSGTEAGLLGCI